MALFTLSRFPMSSSPRQSSRRSSWWGAGAIVAVVTLAATVGLVLPPIDRASAVTVGDGACASTVDGLTAEAKLVDYLLGPTCGVLFTSGAGTWTVPTGVTEVYLEVVAGGGGAGNFGGGGGGEVIGAGRTTRKIVTVVPGASIPVAVGDGGAGGNYLTPATNGGNSIFGSVTAKGGGAGGSWNALTGEGTPGAEGGNGGGGAPITTSIDAFEGTTGGAASGYEVPGLAGGAGVGWRSTYSGGGSPLISPANRLAGGGGGGNGSFYGYTDLAIRNATIAPQSSVTSGDGAIGPLALGLAESVTSRDLRTWTEGKGFGRGGCGGAATGAEAPALNLGCNDYGEFTAGGYERFGLSYVPPGRPNANSGQGGNGGGSLDGLSKGSDGASGLVAIGFLPPGGSADGTPSAPTNVNGSPGAGQAEVGWTEPGSDGGSPITGYGVEWSTDGGATWNLASMCSGTATSCTVTGLTNDTGYVFRVSATNANGTGPWSEPSSAVTPGGTVTPRFTGNANGTGSWSEPSGTVTPGGSVTPRFTG